MSLAVWRRRSKEERSRGEAEDRKRIVNNENKIRSGDKKLTTRDEKRIKPKRKDETK